MTPNWELYGFGIYNDPHLNYSRYSYSTEFVVARFSCPDEAFKYIEDSKLKRPLFDRTFKMNSLLSPFRYASIRYREPVSNIPVNPELEN